MSDHYDVLGLPRDATEDQIREAFRRLSLQFHPDKNRRGTEQFRRIYEAYSFLKEPRNRASNDSVALQPTNVGTVGIVNGFGQLVELTRRWFPMPSESSPGYFYEKLRVAVFIGGVVVGAYVSYRIFQSSPPSPPIAVPVPVPETIIPQSAVQELSEVHPASLWTLISWLAALRSKRILGLGKLASGSNIRLSSRALKESLSSAANVVAKTALQGPRAVTSAISSSSVSSAASVVAKSLPTQPQNALNSAAEVVAKTLAHGSQAVVSSASKTVVAEALNKASHTGYSSLSAAAEVVAKTAIQGPRAVTSAISSSSVSSAASVVAKSLPTQPQIALNSAAEVVTKTLAHSSQAVVSSASKTVVAETLKKGSHTGYSSAANDITKKTATGLLKYWKWTIGSIGRGSAAVNPALTNLKTSVVNGASNGWKWTESKSSSAANDITKKTATGLLKYWKWTIGSIGRGSAAVNPALTNLKTSVVNGASNGWKWTGSKTSPYLSRVNRASMNAIINNSSSVLSSAAKSSTKVIEKGTSKVSSMWPVNLTSALRSSSSSAISSVSRALTEVIKKRSPSNPISSKAQTAAPVGESIPSPPSTSNLSENLPTTQKVVPIYKIIIEPKKEIGFYSAAKNAMKSTYGGVSSTVSPAITATTKVAVKGATTGWNWTSKSFTNTVKPAVSASANSVASVASTSWNWTASKTGSYLVSPLKKTYKATLDWVAPPKK
ncbi:uncharacterized protein [Drosophila takahashii]|uniref:uncharacterized protein isoform X2 n=1 Tax=Drosophila takahashii TaxID=29030 RepID=UPI003898D72B